VFLEVTSEDLLDEMTDLDKKFVYLFRGDANERAKVARFASQLKASGISPVLIDMRQHKEAYCEFLRIRSPKSGEKQV
jgi:hypothetical protein